MAVQDQVVVRRGVEIHEGLRNYMMKVYTHMGLGLAISGAVAYAMSTSPALMRAVFQSPLSWLVLLAPFAMVMLLTPAMNRLSVNGVRIGFAGFAAVMGVSLSTIFLVYAHESIVQVFGVSAAMFLGMGVYGYSAKRDLTSMGSFLIMGAWGLLLAIIVNVFMKSAALAYALSAIGVLIFTGLTAFDVQRIRLMYSEADGEDTLGKKALMSALVLYMDFINIFIHMLNLFGNRK